MITIVDYGMGNLGSVLNMLKRVGVEAEISSDAATIARAGKLLLPGVGAFDKAMARMEATGLREVLDRRVLEDGVPILGICLGMQLLTRSSEEGELKGLGWIAADTLRFPAESGIKVPHMGWNDVVPSHVSELTRDLPDEARFYFVHSFYVRADDRADVILQATHGIAFDAAVQHGNIYGAQFHPEKSHKFGMKLLRNFADLSC